VEKNVFQFLAIPSRQISKSGKKVLMQTKKLSEKKQLKCVREFMDHPSVFLGPLREFLELGDGFGRFRKAF